MNLWKMDRLTRFNYYILLCEVTKFEKEEGTACSCSYVESSQSYTLHANKYTCWYSTTCVKNKHTK